MDQANLRANPRTDSSHRLSTQDVEPRATGAVWKLFALAGTCFLAGMAVIGFDCIVSHWMYGRHIPRFIVRLGDYGELLGRGEAILLVAILVIALDPNWRKKIPCLVIYSALSGLAAASLKGLIARTRPNMIDWTQPRMLDGVIGRGWETFGHWFPMTSAGSGGQSFPSAHTATAVGLALALTQLYPRGRYLFIALPLLVGYQRMQSGDHYLSDVLCGAAVACAVVGMLRGLVIPRIRALLGYNAPLVVE